MKVKYLIQGILSRVCFYFGGTVHWSQPRWLPIPDKKDRLLAAPSHYVHVYYPDSNQIIMIPGYTNPSRLLKDGATLYSPITFPKPPTAR